VPDCSWAGDEADTVLLTVMRAPGMSASNHAGDIESPVQPAQDKRCCGGSLRLLPAMAEKMLAMELFPTTSALHPVELDAF